MYLTVERVLGYFPDLKERFEASKVSQDMIEQWIRDASSIIDLYVGRRYSVPIRVECPIIVTLCKELVEYFDCKNRYTPSYGGEVDVEKWLKERYERVIRLLENIASGEFPLYDQNGDFIVPDPVKVVKPHSNNQDSEPIFKITKDPTDWKVPEGYAGER